jgi:hypothetical protein
LERNEESAFERNGLKSILIPSPIDFVDGSAFASVNLTSLSRWGHPGRYRICDPFLEDISGSIIYRYFGDYQSILIPSSVIILSKSSFSYCEQLESITFELIFFLP